MTEKLCDRPVYDLSYMHGVLLRGTEEQDRPKHRLRNGWNVVSIHLLIYSLLQLIEFNYSFKLILFKLVLLDIFWLAYVFFFSSRF